MPAKYAVVGQGLYGFYFGFAFADAAFELFPGQVCLFLILPQRFAEVSQRITESLF